MQSTAEFFNLLIKGQQKIRDIWKQQIEAEHRIEQDVLKQKKLTSALNNAEKDLKDGNGVTSLKEHQIFMNGNSFQ